MKIEKIKETPKYILKMIQKQDQESYLSETGHLRFYSYLTKNDGELVQVTVAVKRYKKKWYHKQVVVRGIHSKLAFVRDIACRYMGGYSVGWYDLGLYKEEKWYEDGKWYPYNEKTFNPYAPIVNLDYLAGFPEYQYAMWQKYTYPSILKYLRIYEAFPQVEYFVKMGLSPYYCTSIQLLRKAGKDKGFRKFLFQNREALGCCKWYIPTILETYKTNGNFEEVQEFERKKHELRFDKDYRPIRQVIQSDYKNYFAYIEKQNISHRLYLDYAKACLYIDLDMTQKKNRYPHDFRHWHDIRVKEQKKLRVIRDAEERPELYTRFAAIAEKYKKLQYEDDSDYVVIIAKNPAELIVEGETLGHCVGRMQYDEKFADEESLIFFVREREKPSTPFMTIEYSIPRKRILQCYGKNHTPLHGSVEHYVKEIWLPYANKTMRKIKKLAA